MSKKKVMFKAPFADHSGYATVARNLYLALHKLDKFELYLEPIVWINSGDLNLPEDDVRILEEGIKRASTLTQDSVKDISLVHFTIATEFYGKTTGFKRNIGFTMLETDTVAPYWAHKCNTMDAIFVPSMFCLSSFMQSGVVAPIRVIPFGIDFEQYTLDGPKLLSNLPTSFNFLCVGQWLLSGDRKNMVGTIRSFLATFRGNPNVGLILKTYHESAGTIDKGAIRSSIANLRREMGIAENEYPHIYVVHGAVSPQDMIGLYRSADAFVLPTLGEAWGMPLLEAAAMGLPIITTKGSGAEMFLNPEYSVMLDYTWKEIGHALHWPGVYEPQQKLTIPNMEECARMMNRVYNNQGISTEAGMAQRQEIIDRDFSWKASAEKFAQVLEEFDEDDI